MWLLAARVQVSALLAKRLAAIACLTVLGLDVIAGVAVGVVVVDIRED
jgi:hypothetical protein